MSEHSHQVALFSWAEMAAHAHPELNFMYAVPNGGLRSKATAGKLKAEGVKPGVPDICLPVSRGPWHGLYIEMKYGSNRTSSLQEAWLEGLEGQGYQAMVFWDWEKAKDHILAYLALPKGVLCRRSI